jgi:TRAP transporter 4TM/12TM fusion protein
VLGLIFIVFPMGKRASRQAMGSAWWRPGGVPLYDWALFLLTAATIIYIPASYATIAFRIGAPNATDVVLGTITIFIVLEAARRSMGLALPIIAALFILFALWGPIMPGPLVHPGTKWSALVDHLYMTTEGIFGLPAMVVATYVFHFVLFGVVATRMGLGQLFIDVAQCVAGRYAGGPAKVSVMSSAMFGTISGSSIANTVTTGALTIPAMRRIGYQPHFAAGVEAAASTGGQITPPILGAAAFIMVEFLEVPYRHIVLAAMIPATMHFLGVLSMVHFEAKRLGLRGLREDELPRFTAIMRTGWPTLIPLLVLIAYIAWGYSPYKAAFAGITACLVIGFINPYQRLTVYDAIDSFQLGAKYALAVGAAAAAVGIIVGVVTLSGVAFKISFIVTTFASDLASAVMPLVPFGLFAQPDITLFLTLVFIAMKHSTL